jgi:hypothetical protein
MRETIIELLKQVRPDIDLREGSPMYIYLVDALVALAGNLVEEIEEGRELDPADSASMFFVDEGEAVNSEFTIRLYFNIPVALEYSAGAMSFLSRSGDVYTNKLPVSMKANYMALYTDESYYYHDIIVTGESPASTDTELIWDGATENFSHIVITNIITAGSLGLSSTDISVRTRRELSLRNNISSPGVTAYLSNLFQSSLVDILVQGYLDPEMQRDIYNNLHLGKCVDVYVKGTYPSNKVVKVDCEELDRNEGDAVTVIESPHTLPHVSLNTCTVSSWIRTLPANGWANETTFTEGVHYTIDMPNGVFAIVGADVSDDTKIMSGKVGVIGASANEFDIDLAIDLTHVLVGDMILWEGEFYLVKGTRVFGVHHFVEVDREIDPYSGSGDMYLYEPVRVSYTYTPIGVELNAFDNPVLSLDSVNVLDPLTDEIIEETIEPITGFGTGNFGLGGYGRGNVTGYEFNVDDENLRYSIYEEGFIEIPRDYYLERIGVNYSMDSFVSAVQDVLDQNRPKTASLIAFAFIPCQVNMDLLVVDSSIDITSIRYMIWEMPGQLELTDLVNQLYTLGQDPVKWSDFYQRSTYRVWKRDGSYVTVIPDADGIVTLSSLAERFLPKSITTRTS